MESYRTYTFTLDANDNPIIVSLDDRVSLHYQAWAGMPEGFSIDFVPAQLPILKDLCQRLEALEEEGLAMRGATIWAQPPTTEDRDL